MAVLGIFSGSFCQGDEVCRRIAASLGYLDIETQLLEEAARRFDLSTAKVQKALVGEEPLLNRFTHEREKNLAMLRLVLAEMIQPDNVIVRGCMVHLIPRTIGHVLRVCLIANHEYRVEQAAREKGVSPRDAARLIHESDKAAFACTDHLVQKPAYDESLFDMVLPMHDRTVDQAAATIAEHALSRPIQTTARSRQAARDFVLSAQVGLALAEEGLNGDVFSENGRVILSINESVVRLEKHRERLAEIASRVPGVADVTTRLGPRYKATPVNPWANIEGPPKIMLVDDEKEFVHTLSERLRTRQLESSIAYDGEQALDMLKSEVPDVMVLDLMMPGIDGIETLRRIKRDHPRVEVIILTGHGSDREKQMAEELGAFAYLNKPVDVDVLARVMREAYGQAARSGTETDTDKDERANG